MRPALALLAGLRSEEAGQEGIEYLLATGAIAVVFAAVFLGAIAVIVPGVLNTICDAVDPLGGSGNCLTLL